MRNLSSSSRADRSPDEQTKSGARGCCCRVAAQQRQWSEPAGRGESEATLDGTLKLASSACAALLTERTMS